MHPLVVKLQEDEKAVKRREPETTAAQSEKRVLRWKLRLPCN